MNGAGELVTSRTRPAGTDPRVDLRGKSHELRPTQQSPLLFDPVGMLMEAHDRAVDQALCRRGPSNATITSEALMTALADGRSQVPSANTDRGPK